MCVIGETLMGEVPPSVWRRIDSERVVKCALLLRKVEVGGLRW